MPYEAALSEEPWPTIRMVVAPRSRISVAIRANSVSCSSSRSSAAGCSRISSRNWAPGSRAGASASSADDTCASFHEHALDLEVVSEHDEVGREPDSDATGRRKTEHASRHLGRGTDRVLEWNAQRVEVPDGVDHRQRAPRKRPARAAREPVADLDVEVAQTVGAVVQAGAGHGVGGERETSLCG